VRPRVVVLVGIANKNLTQMVRAEDNNIQQPSAMWRCFFFARRQPVFYQVSHFIESYDHDRSNMVSLGFPLGASCHVAESIGWNLTPHHEGESCLVS
jgi:hypothetical protein